MLITSAPFLLGISLVAVFTVKTDILPTRYLGINTTPQTIPALLNTNLPESLVQWGGRLVDLTDVKF